jgi:hypothetical protein
LIKQYKKAGSIIADEIWPIPALSR